MFISLQRTSAHYSLLHCESIKVYQLIDELQLSTVGQCTFNSHKNTFHGITLSIRPRSGAGGARGR